MSLHLGGKMDISLLKQVLSYDPETGYLVWIKKPCKNKMIGEFAGHKSKNGYLQIGFNNKLHYGHRIAWALFYNEQPPKMIDHINGDRTDNRICNLREASNAENVRNKIKTSRNSTGYKGVSYHVKNKKYVASIGFNMKSIYIGSFNTAEEAHAAYCKKATELHGEFFRP